jgi:hypothetical protein
LRLFDESQWVVLPEIRRTTECALTAFTLISRAAAVTQFLLVGSHQGFPYKLFELLECHSDDVVNDIMEKPCLHDRFTKHHISVFGREIGSEESRRILAAVAVMLRIDISLIECRHAKFRKHQTSKSVQTWCEDFSGTSANFVLAQQRLYEVAPLVDRRAFAKKRAAALGAPSANAGRTAGRPKHKRGSGGPWRAFLSDRLGSQHRRVAQGVDMAQLSLEYRAIKAAQGDEWQRLLAEGKAATRKRQLGFSAFGRTRGGLAKKHEPKRLPFSKSLNESLAAAQSDANRSRLSAKRAREAEDDLCVRSSIGRISPHQDAGIGTISRGLGAMTENLVSELVHQSTWEIPAIAMSREALPRLTTDEREMLLKDWAKRHDLLRHSDAESMGNPPGKLGLCYFAGQCLCQGRGLRNRHFHDAVVKVLKTVLRKGTRPRQLAENVGVIAVCFQSRAHTVWFHLAYMNYNTWWFVLLPLEISDCPVRAPLSVRAFTLRT